MELAIALEQTEDKLQEIAEAFYDIPFENSQFQTRSRKLYYFY